MLPECDQEMEALGCIAPSHARGTCDEPRENSDSERIIIRGGGRNGEVANVCAKVSATERISLGLFVTHQHEGHRWCLHAPSRMNHRYSPQMQDKQGPSMAMTSPWRATCPCPRIPSRLPLLSLADKEASSSGGEFHRRSGGES